MQGNILGQSGISVNNSLFPIYQQTAEPYKKFGVWIKSNEVIKNLYFQTDDVRESEVVSDLPFDFYGCATSIDSDIYLFGGR